VLGLLDDRCSRSGYSTTGARPRALDDRCKGVGEVYPGPVLDVGS
jgi:hypothetical protein